MNGFSKKKLPHLGARLIGILRTPPHVDYPSAIETVYRACKSGLKFVEITANSKDWQKAIESLIKRKKIKGEILQKITIGVGSVKNLDVAKEAIDLGAEFLVSPAVFEEVVEYAVERNVPIIPGVFTNDEVELAKSLGVVDLKFFPANSKNHAELYKAMSEPYRDEFDELVRKGWQIVTYDSCNECIDRIRVDTPRQFYKQYLYASREKPTKPIVIEFPAGKKGFERLSEIVDLNSSSVNIYAVGGVNDQNMSDVFRKYNAYGVCPGKGMFDPKAISEGDYEKIELDVKRYVDIANKVLAISK